MKILVTGAAGQLGSDVVARLNELNIPNIPATRSDFDITSSEQVRAFFSKEKPDAVIHCAAYTAVDKAESEKETCYAVNVTGSENIASAAAETGAKLLYVSTDYVFDGKGSDPHGVFDNVNPVNYYGLTKLMGEAKVIENCEKGFIVRISWAFGLNGRNFVRSMLWLGEHKTELNVVDDQVGSPTFTKDLAKLLCDMIQTEKYGIYHATNEGFCSWAQFASEIMKQSGTDCVINPIKSSEYPCDAERPLNSRLSKKSLDEAGFERLPSWQDALGRYLAEYTE